MPLDEALGITPYQASSEELIRLGCLLSIVMPYDLSSWMLHQCTGIAVSASTLWNWVEQYGASSTSRLEAQLEQALLNRGMTWRPPLRRRASFDSGNCYSIYLEQSPPRLFTEIGMGTSQNFR